MKQVALLKIVTEVVEVWQPDNDKLSFQLLQLHKEQRQFGPMMSSSAVVRLRVSDRKNVSCSPRNTQQTNCAVLHS